MVENSNIEWTDHTFNPWIGCTEVSPACDHCYARVMMQDRYHRVEWGNHPRLRTKPANWAQPIRWNAEAEAKGIRAKVFCASLADVFDNKADPAWRDDLWHLIEATPALDWLLLTKRPQNINGMYTAPSDDPRCPHPNVWLGTTVENQEEADRRIPHLLAWPAKVRFLSCEPLLSKLDIRWALSRNPFEIAAGYLARGLFAPGAEYLKPISWVICGGESGPGARPTNPDWARSLHDQCAAAGVPFFMKQWGDWAPLGQFEASGWERTGSDDTGETTGRLSGSMPDMAPLFKGRSFPTRYPFRTGPDPGACMVRVGKHAAGALLDGQLHRGFPA